MGRASSKPSRIVPGTPAAQVAAAHRSAVLVGDHAEPCHAVVARSHDDGRVLNDLDEQPQDRAMDAQAAASRSLLSNLV